MKTLTREYIIKNKHIVKYPIVSTGAKLKSSETQKLTVLESGPEAVLMNSIIRVIDRATQMICLQSFLIQDGNIIEAMCRAAERGVKLFVLSSAEARLSDRIIEEDDFMRDAYIKLLEDNFKNRFVHRVAANFHAKFILIDPKTHPKGYICTCNFTQHGLTRNPELAVSISETQCAELFKIFVYHFWECSSDEQNHTCEFDKVVSAKKFNFPRLQELLVTSPVSEYSNLNSILIKAVDGAKTSISLSSFLIEKNMEIIQLLKQKAKEGLLVHVFCRPNERLYKDLLIELVDLGVEVYMHPFIHAKSLVVDNNKGFVLTANFAEEGLVKGFEIGVELDALQTKDLVEIHNNWLENFPYVIEKELNVQDIIQIAEFKNGKLFKFKYKEKESICKNTQVETTGQLIDFFNEKISGSKFCKLLEVSLVAEMVQKKYKSNLEQSAELIEFVSQKKNKYKAVLIDEAFSVEHIDHLEKWRNNKIFFLSKN